MLETNVCHALGLHMHQPPGNLELLIDANPWEAEQIIHCYERPARYARRYGDIGHLHVGFSGILLEQLRDPVVVDRYRHLLDIPAMLDAYRETPNIELIGMGHFHPIFPLIPPRDWEDQLRIGRELMADTFGRTPRGFWPPEMAFSMEMIPALVRAGYEYVIVDGVHVHPEDGVIDVFRPYRACHDGVCITVVPRDRDVSNAQESGLDAAWFAHEVTHRCRFSPRPHESRLVTTWSDGENGGWFRQMHEGSGFFGHYFAPFMEHVRGGEYPVRPVSLSAYLAEHPPQAQAHVQTGAWNVGSTSGFDFSQWAGSPGQQRGGAAVNALSQRWWALAGRLRTDAAGGPVPHPNPNPNPSIDQAAAAVGAEPAPSVGAASAPASSAATVAGIDPETQRAAIAAARRQVLLAQTSCYLFWGDDWLPKLDAVLATGNAELAAIEAALQAPTGAATAPTAIPVAASAAGPATVTNRPGAASAARHGGAAAQDQPTSATQPGGPPGAGRVAAVTAKGVPPAAPPPGRRPAAPPSEPAFPNTSPDAERRAGLALKRSPARPSAVPTVAPTAPPADNPPPAAQPAAAVATTAGTPTGIAADTRAAPTVVSPADPPADPPADSPVQTAADTSVTVPVSDAEAPPQSASSATGAKVASRVGDRAQTDPGTDSGTDPGADPGGGTDARPSRAPGKAAKPARGSARKRR